MAVQIFTVSTGDISALSNGQVFPLGSMIGSKVSCSISLSGFVNEDSTWEIVEWNIGTVGGNEDYTAVGTQFLGADDLILRESADVKKAFLGLRLKQKNTETDGSITVTAVVKE